MPSRHLKPILYGCSAIAGLLLAIGVAGAGASLDWNGDFETGNLSQYSTTYCYQSYSCTVVPAPGAHSGFAAKFQLASGETSPIGSAHAQVQQNSSEQIGDESWWHWDVYLPSDFQDSSSFWQVITEWHHYAVGGGSCNCPGSPPLTFQEINGRYVVRIVDSPDPSQGNYWTQYDLGAATRGAWVGFSLHAKWSDDPAIAVTDVYVNGTLAQHITGHPNEYTGYFNYFLAGWYRASDPQAQTMYLDNVKRGWSLADVEGTAAPTSSSTTSSTVATILPTSSTTTTATPTVATILPTSSTTTTATPTVATILPTGSTTTTTTPTVTATPTTMPTASTTTVATTATTTPSTSTTTSMGEGQTGRKGLRGKSGGDSSNSTSTATSPTTPNYFVTITSPTAGATVKGRVTWTAETVGAAPTREVDFFVDGQQGWTEYWAPYFFGGDNQYWDTATVKNGSHTLMVRAVSTTGDIAFWTMSVTVDNKIKTPGAT